ncbi:uncharacterized protein LOC114309870 isoform X1 [Camellia sinensis]|uniref:uncharacterized protein LOC114309870 isoform X1 n=1 Tax=Camellia sinensis TaxID=4442 RepID=UPI0010355CAB|nr:uncharacterized protein LOC114309870 isoform X1 [Camellia sinensis]
MGIIFPLLTPPMAILPLIRLTTSRWAVLELSMRLAFASNPLSPLFVSFLLRFPTLIRQKHMIPVPQLAVQHPRQTKPKLENWMGLCVKTGKMSEDGSSSKPQQKTMVSNAKFELEKFDGTNNFGMWQCEVLDVPTQQELDIALEKKTLGDG